MNQKMKINTKTLFLVVISIITCFHTIKSQDFTSAKHFILINQFDSIDNVYLKHPEIRPKNKRIIINKNEILFLNADQSIAKTMLRKQDFDIDTSVSFYGQEKVKGIRKGFYYRVIDNRLLTESIGLYGTSGATHQNKGLEKRVFNSSGDFIVNVDPYHFVVVSNDGKFFASYYEGEGDGAPIVMYDNKGDIVCRHCATSDASVSFLPDESLLGIRELYERTIMILNPHCEKVMEIDMKALNIGCMGQFFYSATTKKILLPNPLTVVLFDLEKGEVSWDIEEAYVQDCIFLDKEKELLIKTWDNRIELQNNQYQLKLINITNGGIIEALYADEVLFMDNVYFIIKKDGKYYEYLIE